MDFWKCQPCSVLLLVSEENIVKLWGLYLTFLSYISQRQTIADLNRKPQLDVGQCPMTDSITIAPFIHSNREHDPCPVLGGNEWLHNMYLAKFCCKQHKNNEYAPEKQNMCRSAKACCQFLLNLQLQYRQPRALGWVTPKMSFRIRVIIMDPFTPPFKWCHSAWIHRQNNCVDCCGACACNHQLEPGQTAFSRSYKPWQCACSLNMCVTLWNDS